MNLIQKIKQIFGFGKIKQLEAPKEQESKDIAKPKNDFFEKLNKETIELTKEEKIKQILKTAGCNKEIFWRVDNFESVDVDNLREVLKTLSGTRLTKYELNVILGQNIELLNTSYIFIDTNVQILKEYIKEEIILKNIIYTNPFVLTNKIEDRVLNIKEKFDAIGLSQKEQINMLDENSNILSLDIEVLNQSVNIIKEYYLADAKKIILEDPNIIGITDINILRGYIEN